MFARGAGKPQVTDVAINKVVQSSVDMVGTQFNTNGIDLTTNLAEELPLISANAFSLEEVLFNLLSNARDAVADLPREKAVRVSTEPSDLDGISGIRVTVGDSGTGIEEADLGRVLESPLEIEQ